MRLHYQFVMANERRTVYDYFMLICGPAPFRRTIAEPNGPAGLYRANGSYVDDSRTDVPCAAPLPPASVAENGEVAASCRP
jgi:hypothetical protein